MAHVPFPATAVAPPTLRPTGTADAPPAPGAKPDGERGEAGLLDATASSQSRSAHPDGPADETIGVRRAVTRRMSTGDPSAGGSATGCFVEASDALAVEAPLEIRIGPRASTVLLRTPGHDVELVTGFLYSEGIITRAADLVAIAAVPPTQEAAAAKASSPIVAAPALGGGDGNGGDDGAGGDVVAVTLAAGLRDPARRDFVPLAGERVPRAPAERLFYASSSCGACGKTSLAALAVEAPVVTAQLEVPFVVLTSLPERLRAAQVAFAATGGLHGAALFSAAGELLALREDVGRHNAVDKLVGWALAAGRLPLADCVLQVSGRLGYEIVQKAIVAGIPVLSSVGAGSTLAIELAVQFGLTVATFVRRDSCNLWGDPRRVTPG